MPEMILPRMHTLRQLLKSGWAPAIQTFFDLGVSSYQGLLCGQLGAVAVAVNTVVLDVSAFVYMFSAGMAAAMGALVGHAFGIRDLVLVNYEPMRVSLSALPGHF